MMTENPFQRFRFRREEPRPMDEVPRSSPGMDEEAPPGSVYEGLDKRRALDPNNADSSAGITGGSNYFDEIQKLRGNMPISGQYRQLLATPPNREDYKPSGMRRFGAAVAGGLGAYSGGVGQGLDVARDINDAPYKNAMSDYTTKAATLGRGADLEQKDFDNLSGAMNEANRLGISYADFQERQRNNQANNETARIRANAAATTANKHEYNYIQTMTGVKAVNKNDPTDTFEIPGETVASMQAKTQRGMLGVAQQNAGTNARRANIDASRNDWQREQGAQGLGIRERTVANQETRTAQLGDKKPSVIDQSRARDLGLRSLATDPNLSQYIDTSNPNFPEIKGNLDDDHYQIIEEELNDRIQEYLSGKRAEDAN